MKKVLRTGWPVAVIAAIWILFSFPYFGKGLVPFPSDYLATFFPPWSAYYGMPVKNNAMPDVITQIYPWKKLTVESWKSGAFPLWNPYSFSGTAQAGNYQSAVFSPMNLLFLVFPFMDAWSLLILFQPLLAGICMYLFVRSLDRSRPAATVSAIAFMFCGFVTTWMAYGTLGYAALWLPLIFWGIHRKHKIAVSLGIALSFLAGHFQISIYVLLASVAFALWNKRWRSIIYCFIGVGIASPQLLLSAHSYLQSARPEVLRGEIIPWSYLVTLFAPDFYGNPVTRNDWYGHYAEWAGFIGVTPLVLSLTAVLRRQRMIWFFILLAGVSILFALPTPLNALLYTLRVPVLAGSAASRIIVLSSFSLAVLSAYGMDLIPTLKVFRICAGIVLFVSLIWGIVFFGKPFPADKNSIALHNLVLPSLLAAGTALCIAAGKIRKQWVRAGVIVVLILLTSFDLLRFAVKWMPFEERKYVYPDVPSLRYLETYAGENRVFGNIGNEVGNMFHLQLVEGYDALYQKRYGEFIDFVSRGTVSPPERSVVRFDKHGVYTTEALQLLGIRYIYHRFSDGRVSWVFPYWQYPAMRQVYSDEIYEIFEYPDAFPRTFLASSYVIGDLDTLFSPDLDRKNTVVLEEKPAADPQPGTGSATIVSYKPSWVTVKTEADSAKLLFLSDVYDSGWRAMVDGKPARIYRADYDFRAVAVPGGAHTVQFTYKPAGFLWGWVISGIVLVLLIIL